MVCRFRRKSLIRKTGVYRCGFAKSQEAYNTAFNELFTALDKVEDILDKNRYLAGNKLTEADVRLFTTILRFDPVYFGHFKTNKKHVYEYPNLFNWLLEFYHMNGKIDYEIHFLIFRK